MPWNVMLLIQMKSNVEILPGMKSCKIFLNLYVNGPAEKPRVRTKYIRVSAIPICFVYFWIIPG